MILTSKIKQLLSSPKYLGEELKEGFIINNTAHKFAYKFFPTLASRVGKTNVCPPFNLADLSDFNPINNGLPRRTLKCHLRCLEIPLRKAGKIRYFYKNNLTD